MWNCKALGKVLSGKITQYDKIKHYPSEIEAMAKSIQMHDDDVKESVSPARVGLSLKISNMMRLHVVTVIK